MIRAKKRYCSDLLTKQATVSMVTKLPFYLTSEYYSLSVMFAKPYFIEIGPVHQKLWPFKCMMLKTLNSNFLDSEDTLTATYLLKVK